MMRKYLQEGGNIILNAPTKVFLELMCICGIGIIIIEIFTKFKKRYYN